MSFNIDKFKENVGDLQRATLFHVEFEKEDILRFFANKALIDLASKILKLSVLESSDFKIMEKLEKLCGDKKEIKITSFKPNGDIGGQIVKLIKINKCILELSWDKTNEISCWQIEATIV